MQNSIIISLDEYRLSVEQIDTSSIGQGISEIESYIETWECSLTISKDKFSHAFDGFKGIMALKYQLDTSSFGKTYSYDAFGLELFIECIQNSFFLVKTDAFENTISRHQIDVIRFTIFCDMCLFFGERLLVDVLEISNGSHAMQKIYERFLEFQSSVYL